MRVAYQKLEDKNHEFPCFGRRFSNSYSKSALQVYMAMYSKSLIESHPTMVFTLSGRFRNSLLGWNRGAY